MKGATVVLSATVLETSPPIQLNLVLVRRTQLLTNSNKHWIGSLAISPVANNAAVAPFIGLPHTGNG